MASKEDRKVTEEQMRAHFTSYEASGSTVPEYCKANDLSIHKFTYWRYKVLKRQKPPVGPKRGFSRVSAAPSGAMASSTSDRLATVQVTLANGARVEFFEANTLDLFKALL